jgi:hypothetical protein
MRTDVVAATMNANKLNNSIDLHGCASNKVSIRAVLGSSARQTFGANSLFGSLPLVLAQCGALLARVKEKALAAAVYVRDKLMFLFVRTFFAHRREVVTMGTHPKSRNVSLLSSWLLVVIVGSVLNFEPIRRG